MHIVEEKLLFFHAVGEALAQWAYVENQLWLMTSLAFPLPQRAAVFDGLMAIESFRGRLNICDKYIRRAFSDADYLARWSKTKEVLERLSQKRNGIAHRVPVLYAGAKEGRRYALEDWNPNILPGGGKPTTEAICVQQLDLIQKGVSSAHDGLGQPQQTRFSWCATTSFV
jgi:hypothetical protein